MGNTNTSWENAVRILPQRTQSPTGKRNFTHKYTTKYKVISTRETLPGGGGKVVTEGSAVFKEDSRFKAELNVVPVTG